MELSSIRRCFVAHRESNANTNSPTLYSNLHFNQRTRMGCDLLQRLVNSSQFIGFNPRTRTGCDNHFVLYVFQSLRFNPRTRTGCDPSRSALSKSESVSIHAPARGATLRNSCTSSGQEFQSTHPHGVRHTPFVFPPLCMGVSIHAPARGATIVLLRKFSGIVFQSTHPHGVRLINTIASGLMTSFNPRTRTGCDPKWQSF